jgi:hypothetical protein
LDKSIIHFSYQWLSTGKKQVHPHLQSKLAPEESWTWKQGQLVDDEIKLIAKNLGSILLLYIHRYITAIVLGNCVTKSTKHCFENALG